jgi:manganese/zinc/iron transport system permease protein
MTSLQFEIQLIAAVVAVACALPGVFLVLRRMALMSDAISHSILLGIVLAFFITRNLGSPLLIIGAAATGVLTVALVETIRRTKLVHEDAAIGLVFPALFSIGVILISRHAGDVHLDVDAVLLGELAFAPFQRIELAGRDLGPRALWVMSVILLLNVACITAFYKELQLTTFDPALAAALGFSPALMHYGFMGLVSVTAVGAFDAVGSILVVALMIGPPATAYLITDHLHRMIWLSALFGVVAAVAGYWVAHLLDASIAGSMAGMAGLLFMLVLVFAPSRGILAAVLRRMRQRWEFAQQMLVVHLLNHEGEPDGLEESRVDHLHGHMRWRPDFAERVVRRAEKNDLVVREAGERLVLTAEGRELAAATLSR